MFMRVAALVVCALPIMPVAAADEKSDLDKLQGKWEVVSIVQGGKDAPEERVKSITLAFEKDKLVMMHGDQKREMGFKIDPSKKPKWMTVDMMGKPGEGIYSLEGDTLKVCHGEEGDPRPTEFVSKEGTKLVVITLKRAK